MSTQTRMKARGTALWSTLGAVVLVTGLSASAHAQSSTPYLRSAPVFVPTGKSLNCNIANVNSGKKLQIWAAILSSRNDDTTRRGISNGVIGDQNWVVFSGYQIIDPFFGFLSISSYSTGTPNGMYSCMFAVSSTDGSAVSLADVRATAEVYSGPTATTEIVPVQ